MKILCQLSPWIEKKAERGKGVGNIIKTRLVVACDPWNWIIGEDNGKVINPNTTRYYGSFRQIFSNEKLTNEQVQVIINKLCELKKIDSKGKPTEEYGPKLGKWIDDNFNTSFHKEYPPTVMEDLFGTNEKEKDTETYVDNM